MSQLHTGANGQDHDEGFVWRKRIDRLWLGAVFSIALAASAKIGAQSADLVDTAVLGQRGASLETSGKGFLALPDAQGIGDFDGDGREDIVLAVRESNSSQMAVVLVYGRPDLTENHLLDESLPRTATFRLLDPGRTQSGPVCLSPAGDLNGDGLKDFLFSYGYYERDSSSGVGAAFLVYGSRGLDGEGFAEEVGSGVAGVTFISSDSSYHLYDRDHANIGDFNGDGEADLALGAFSESLGNGKTSGIISVLLKTRSLPAEVDPARIGSDPALPGFKIFGRAGESLGYGIVPAGDFNGDGFDDFLVTSFPAATGGTVYLIYGRANPPPVIDLKDIANGPEKLGVVVFRPPGVLVFGGRGQAIGAGDVNGDGFDDILIGAAASETTPLGETPKPSVVRLFYGQRNFPSQVDFANVPAGLATAIHPLDSGSFGDSFGVSVASAGDMNGDGVPDLLIGASTKSVQGISSAGEAYLVFGKKDLGADLFLDQGFRGIRVLGEMTNGNLGEVVAPAGDFNGDGAMDMLLAAPNTDSGKGRAYVIYGSGSSSPPFTLLDVEPVSGPIRGGTRVLIRGSGFETGAQVFFGDRAAGNVAVPTGSEIRAVTPAFDVPGVVDVVVKNDGQTKRMNGAFEYVPNLPEINLDQLGSRGLRLDGEAGKVIGGSLAFGDITGDGLDELAIGSERDEGWIVSVVHGGTQLPGSLSGLKPSPQVSIIKSSQVRQITGARVQVLGDVDHDGIADLGIGVGDAGGYIFFGRSPLPQEIDIDSEVLSGNGVRLERGSFQSQLSFAPLGDLTGDGIDDFAIGFPEAPMTAAEPRAGAGEILFIQGRSSWPQSIDLSSPSSYFSRIHGVGDNHSLAHELVNVGDVNGDGLPDLLSNSVPNFSNARSYLIYTKRSMPGEMDIESYVQGGGGVILDRLNRTAALTAFIDLAPAGDVNLDGFQDFLLGDETGGDLNRGTVFLVKGGPRLPGTLSLTDPPEDPGIVLFLGAAQHVQAGTVGPAGDFNGDGLSDFLVGSQSPSPPDPGQVWIIFGEKEPPARLELRRLGGHGLLLTGGQQTARVEISASQAGDLNGDGHPDFAFSETGSPGAVYVVYGLSSSLPFIRGDATFDSVVNISDAVYILSFLFLGGPAPPCEDAADTDDRGNIQIGDAIYILNFLFNGGARPPAPFPEPGTDPTDDTLSCRGL